MVFIKYNRLIPKSAPVEKLFLFSTLTGAPRMKSLNDALFEQSVQHRVNNNKR